MHDALLDTAQHALVARMVLMLALVAVAWAQAGPVQPEAEPEN